MKANTKQPPFTPFCFIEIVIAEQMTEVKLQCVEITHTYSFTLYMSRKLITIPTIQNPRTTHKEKESLCECSLGFFFDRVPRKLMEIILKS